MVLVLSPPSRACVQAHALCVRQSTTFESQFFPSTVGSGMERRSTGLHSTLSCWEILLALPLFVDGLLWKEIQWNSRVAGICIKLTKDWDLWGQWGWTDWLGVASWWRWPWVHIALLPHPPNNCGFEIFPIYNIYFKQRKAIRFRGLIQLNFLINNS